MKMDDERHRDEFEEVRKECPWKYRKYNTNQCKALSKDCTQDNCAIFYFKKFFNRRRT